MIRELEHIITKLVVPKYPEIESFSVRVFNTNAYAFHFVDYNIYGNTFLENPIGFSDRLDELIEETKLLFEMMGPGKFYAIYPKYILINSQHERLYWNNNA